MDARRIIEYLKEEAERPVRGSELARALGLAPSERRVLRRLLRRLVERGEVIRVRSGRYAAPGRLRLVTGRLRTWRRGHGVVQSEDGSELYIPAGALGSALDGDRVAARVEGRNRFGRVEGRVVHVLERGRKTIVGRYRAPRGRAAVGYVVPEDVSITQDVVVPVVDESVARPGDMVVARITDWGDEHRSPAGEIERVLGPADAAGVDVLAIIHGHELPLEFPPAAEQRAEQLRARGIRPADLRGRTDFRETLTFTIDPSDAKDHDDALSIEPLDDGRWRVGVHIADVSFYVRPGGALDREARERGTSVYLVDRAVPMLPAALSSGLCSLLPDQDRLTLSVVLTVRSDGTVDDATLVEGVIRSRHRLTYDGVQAVFDGKASIDAETDAALRALLDVSRALRARRRARGSLDFDLPEARIFLDEAGVPVDVQRAERWESHRLVEDLMLLANQTIGGMAKAGRYPFVYRVHEPPDASRIEQLARVARALGFVPAFGDPVTPLEVQRLLDQRPDRPESQLLATLALRSMKQARYSETDLGHFGLATREYTHFTSPIRRYPDLLVHRIVGVRHLGRSFASHDEETLRELARHSSDRERVAVAAERDSIELKKVRFMEGHIGSTFEGTISDVRPFGFFVLLDSYYVEGLVHVSWLADDYYVWDEERFVLTGENTGRRFRVGQRLEVVVSSVDLPERRIEFVPSSRHERPRRGRAPRGRRR